MNVQPPTTRATPPRGARWRVGLAAAAGATALAATLVVWPITTASAAIGAGTYTVTGDLLRLDAERGTWCYLGLYLEARFSVEDGDLRLHADGFRGPVFERYLWGDQVLLSVG